MTNNLLQGLNPDDRAAFNSHLRAISLPRDAVLANPGDEIEKVYFPHSGIVSFLVGLDDGALVQTLMVGTDGVVGAAQALDNKTSLNKIVVQVAGSADVIHRDHLRRIVQDDRTSATYSRRMSNSSSRTSNRPPRAMHVTRSSNAVRAGSCECGISSATSWRLRRRCSGT